MMRYDEYRLLTESLHGGFTLGLSRPSKVGGPVGSNFYEGEFGKKVDDDDDDDDLEGNEHDDDDEGLDGDLSGTSSEDDGPDKNFPPDDSEEVDGLPTPDEEMLDGDDGHDDFLASLQGQHPHDEPDGDEGDFLNDIDSALLGDEMGGDEQGHDMGHEMSEPCPDCNPDGTEEFGDPDCPNCGGVGFLDDADSGHEDHHHHMHHPLDASIEDEEGDGHPDEQMTDFMNLMSAYMKKYMGKSVVPQAPMARQPQAPQVPQRQMMKKFMKKEEKPRHQYSCESHDEFLSSLTNQAKGNVHSKNFSGISEDILLQSLDPNYADNEPKAGDVGFAPQGRLNQIGGGYTKDDFKDIPVLGESVRYPTLAEYAKLKAKLAKKKKR